MRQHPPREADWNPGHIKLIPERIAYADLEDSERSNLQTRLDTLAERLATLPNWDGARVSKLCEVLQSFCFGRFNDFEPCILDDALYGEVVPKFPRMAASIYWNEIDQYIYRYRVQTAELLRLRLIAAMDALSDHLTPVSYTHLTLPTKRIV